MTFHVGDLVKPKREWTRDERDRVIPTGRVTRIVPWGKGQLLYVEGDERRPFISGVFDRVGSE